MKTSTTISSRYLSSLQAILFVSGCKESQGAPWHCVLSEMPEQASLQSLASCSVGNKQIGTHKVNAGGKGICPNPVSSLQKIQDSMLRAIRDCAVVCEAKVERVLGETCMWSGVRLCESTH